MLQNVYPCPCDKASQRVFVESDEGEFFGLNTTIFRTDGLLLNEYE